MTDKQLLQDIYDCLDSMWHCEYEKTPELLNKIKRGIEEMTPKEKQKPFLCRKRHINSEMLGKAILGKLETTQAWVVPIYNDEPTEAQLAKDRDRPDREKMARIICCFAKNNEGCTQCEYNTPRSPFPDCFPDIREETDKLLALSEPLDDEELREKIDELIPFDPLLPAETSGVVTAKILTLINSRIEEEFVQAFAKDYRETHEALHKVDIANAKAEGAKEEKERTIEFINWLDNGTRSSAGWRSEVRNFRQALKESK